MQRRQFLTAFAISLASTTSLASTLSAKSALALEQYGQVNANGVRHVSGVEARAIIKTNPDIVVLDVRTPFEFKRGSIDGAININYYSLSFKKKLEALSRNKTYLVHCQTGVRSGRTIPLMLEAGFTDLIHMDGGYKAWGHS